MEFGKHIDKGLWAIADKSLPAVYGVGLVFLVVRVLPASEFGALAIIQSVFGFTIAIGYAVALLPLTKFLAEKEHPEEYTLLCFLLLFTLIMIVSLVMLLLGGPIARLLDPLSEANLPVLLRYLPLLLLTSFYRNFAINFLQAKYQVRRIFWIDSIYFLGVLLLIYVLQRLGRFHSAEDVLSAMVLMFSASSMYAIVTTSRQIRFAKRIGREVWMDVWRFGRFTFGGNAIYTVYSQLDVLLVSSFAGVVALAAYNAAKTFTKIFDVIGQILSMFLLPFSSKWYAQNDVPRLTVTAEKAICFSSLLLLPVFIVLFFFPESVLHLLFRGRYDQSAHILRIFSVLSLLIPWNVVAGSYVTGVGRTKEGFYIGLVHITIAGACLFLGASVFGAVGAAAAYVFSFSIFTLILFWYVNRIIPISVVGALSRVKDVREFLRAKL